MPLPKQRPPRREPQHERRAVEKRPRAGYEPQTDPDREQVDRLLVEAARMRANRALSE